MSMGMRETLAIRGGSPACRDLPDPAWPVTTADDIEAVVAVLRSGLLVSDRNVLTPVHTFEQRWAQHLGVKHCIAVANGTLAIELALRAVGVGPGDEVLVPALSFVATAMAVRVIGAVPVFVDVDPQSFNLDPARLEALVSPRTKAVLVVHLHGAASDMDAILQSASDHSLAVIEDSAQAQGASHHGRACGSLGDAGTFSLQMTKNLPTCGEGGMVVTNDDAIAEHVVRARQFGELIRVGEERTYRSESVGTNAKLGAVQAAYATSQLDRFVEWDAIRKQNVRSFLDLLGGLPHLRVPTAADGTEHAWHILRFDIDRPGPLEDIAPRRRRLLLMRALAAEGVPVSRYQTLPLPEQPALMDAVIQPSAEWSHASRVVNQTFTLQRRHLPPDAMPVLSAYARAFQKVFLNAAELREVAQ